MWNRDDLLLIDCFFYTFWITKTLYDSYNVPTDAPEILNVQRGDVATLVRRPTSQRHLDALGDMRVVIAVPCRRRKIVSSFANHGVGKRQRWC